ncbi:MAG TPA: hypothetical protein VHU85_01980 [Acidimicrobiales bacterium]|jgi:hypothetical protein|nr:hypothetical protein [Acidimicrobiales bacterium]
MSGAPASRPSRPARPAWSASFWPVSLAVTVVAFGVGVVKLVTDFGKPYYHYGDQAVLASRVGDAMRFHVELGPYSRFGWSHPGPALFYLQAPIYSLSNTNPRSLFVGSLLINGICIVAALAVVRRFAGEWSALWAAAVVGVTLLALGANAIETFWNPDLEAAGVLLVMVLTAGAIAGSGLSVLGLAVVGSYVVQTDVGTVPIIGVMAVASVIGYFVQLVVRRRHRRRRRNRRRAERRTVRLFPLVAAAAGVAVLAVAWIPPLAQQFRGHPGNLTALYDFFTNPTATAAKFGSTHSLSAAWAVVANSTTAVPFGNVSNTAVMTTASAGRQWTVVVWAGLAVIGLVWAVWRRRWFAFGLGFTTLVGLAVSVIAVERIVGPIGNYLGFWMQLVPVPAVVAIGVLTVEARQPRPAPADSPTDSPTVSPVWWRVGIGWALAVVLVLPMVGVAGQLGRGSALVDSTGNPEIAQLTGFTTAHLKLSSARDVLVVMGNADRWPEASGLVLQLSNDGYHPTVTPTWGFMFTPRYVAGSAPQAQVVLTDGTGTSAPATALSQTYSLGDVPTTITFVPAPTG